MIDLSDRTKFIDAKTSRLNVIFLLQMMAKALQISAALGVTAYIYQRTHSAFAVSALVFARLTPAILFGIVSGAYADYISTRIGYFTSSLLTSLVAFAIASVTFLHPINEYTELAILIFIGSAADCFSSAFFQKRALILIQDIVSLSKESKRAALHGRLSFVDTIPSLFGPAIAGLFLLTQPNWQLNIIDGLSWLFVSACSLVVLPDFEVKVQKARVRKSDFVYGVRRITRDPLFRKLQAMFSAINFCNGVTTGLLPAFLLSSSGGSGSNYAFFMVVSACGGVAGSTLSSTSILTRFGLDRIMIIGIFIGAMSGRVLVSLASGLLLIAAGLFTRSFSTSVSNSANQAIWHRHVSNDETGRVFGARRLLSQGPFPIGTLFGGLMIFPVHRALVETSTIAPTNLQAIRIIFFLFGLLEVAVLVPFLLSNRRRRKDLSVKS